MLAYTELQAIHTNRMAGSWPTGGSPFSSQSVAARTVRFDGAGLVAGGDAA
jgi:hypothetical protein